MKATVFTFLFVIAGSASVLAYPPDLTLVGPILDATAGTSVVTSYAPFTSSDGSNQSSYRLTHHKREQLLANLEQIAVLNQAYTVQFNELIKSSRVALAQEVGADKVAEMTDQEVIAAFLK